jgi:hypothetical protein
MLRDSAPEREAYLEAAWKHCAPGAATERGFPRGFWPDVARVAVEMALQNSQEPTLDFTPTKCSRGGFERPKVKDKKKLSEAILSDLEGMF